MEKTNYEIRIGDSFDIPIAVGEDITGWSFELLVMDEKGASTYVLQKTVAAHNDAENGNTSIGITAAESALISGTKYYLVKYTTPAGSVKTFLAGVMTFGTNVTTTVTDGVTITVTGSAAVGFASETLATDGVETSFQFASTFRAGSLVVYRDGVLATRGTDYAEKADRSGVDFATAPAADEEWTVQYAV